MRLNRQCKLIYLELFMEKMKFFHRSVLVICCCITKHSTTYRLKPVVYYYATQFCGLTGFLLGVFCEAVVRCHLGLQSHQKVQLG